jgi:hypothetical protein
MGNHAGELVLAHSGEIGFEVDADEMFTAQPKQPTAGPRIPLTVIQETTRRTAG